MNLIQQTKSVAPNKVVQEDLEPSEQNQSVRKFSLDILTSFGGEIFLFVSSFILGVLTARYLGADGKGQFNVIYYAVGLMSTIFSIRFQRSIIYYLSKNKEMLGEAICTAAVVGFFAFSCVVIFPTIFHDFFYNTLFRGINISLFLLILICSSTYLWDLLIALFAGLNLYRIRAFFMGASFLLKSVLVVITLGLLQKKIFDLIFIMGLVETLVYSIILIFMLSKAKYIRINLPVFLGMLKYAFQSFPGMLSDLVTLRIDVFFVNYFVGPSQVGIYTVAISMANMLLYIPSAARSVLMPYIASSSDQEITPKLTRVLIIILSILALIFIPVMWILMPLVYGSEFAFSRILYLILLPGTIFWGIFILLSSDLEGRGLPWKVSTVSMRVALVTIVLNLIIIPILGNVGAAIVSSITYFVSMLLVIHLYMQLTKVKANDILIPRKEDFLIILKILNQLFGKVRGFVDGLIPGSYRL